jgi:molybdopterin-containing oxidoreductase family iron-sulfur binding subunit
MTDEIKRRDFLKLVSLGGAATVLSNCTQPVEKVIPYLVKEEDVTPGESIYFATVCRECPAGCGIIVRTREGRALKAEGNPEHPVNAGKLCMRGQASMQGLYNPDRFRSAARVADGKYADVAWDEAIAEAGAKLKEAGGNGIVYLGGLNSGTMEQLVSDFLNAVGSTSNYNYEAISYEPLRQAAQRTFGVNAVPFHDLSKAQYIVSFGADFLETWLSPVEYARQFAGMHAYRDGKMGKFTYVGPRMSLTGANADKWIGSRPGQELAVALGVLNVIVSENLGKNDIGGAKSIVADYTPERVATVAGVEADAIRQVARDFANGTSAALAGVTVANAEALAAVVNLLNYAAGNVGTTVQFGPNQNQGAASADLNGLIDRMSKGEVKVLVINDVNPAFSLPNSANWNEAIKKVPYVVVITSYPTETSAQANLVLAAHTPYEQWNDYVPRQGVHGLMQPVMRPLYPTRHPGDILLALAQSVRPGAGGFANYEDYLRSAWQKLHGQVGGGKPFNDFFNEALQRGGVFTTASATSVRLSGDVANLDVKAPAIEGEALVAYPTIQFYDGRLANRPWMQEIPDPMTKIAWDSWIEVNPKTAAKLGVKNGDMLKVATNIGEVEAPAYLYQGIREDVFAAPIGQGHTAFGRYAGEIHSGRGWLETVDAPRGVNPYAVLPAVALVAQAKVSKGSGHVPLAIMQGSDVQRDQEVAKVVPLAQVSMLAQKAAKIAEEQQEAMAHDPVHGKRHVEFGTIENRVQGQLGEQPGQNFYIPHNHPEYRWGMAIDLSSCIGCGACAIACYAENNIPIVGPELMTKGREMAWLWIERYYEGENPDSPSVHFIPMLCQHCDNAPCESVCPVYATYHNPEGLNAMVYNRCVGTRYCGNNCPYKVRRFNWFEYEWPEPLHMQLNPDVLARGKGVMEKCTFCVQRTREAKETARFEDRTLRDGDVMSACQQTCPTDAIVFGDLKDPNSKVAQLVRNPRGYRVLEELNTQSAITYLREVVHES